MNQLVASDMVIGLPKLPIPDKICEVCLFGKQPRNAYSSYLPMTTSNVLNVIHSNVCAPFEVPSLGGKKYFTSFVDEYSRMMWLYLIKSKDEVLSSFKKFRVMIEKQCRIAIKILWTDGGKEYTSKAFKFYCEKHGILHEVTTPYTPQHNELVERINRTILEMARSMMEHKDLPHSFQGEVISTTTYLLNRCLTKRLKKKVLSLEGNLW